MLTNEKVNSELRDYINTGYEILMNNMDYEAQANISSIMKLSVANDEGSSFEFKRNMLIGILEKVKDEEE
ncbi:hypothetical protein ARH93_05415 [Listeria monocytogenes]|uniref:hypothetical protein n=1 Tax=Listeria monocytogenes TaxID=1639 RepID=UPI0009951FD4|nr:hypothetical protein [Listeria monocytogenes]EAC4638185.1 hypothetical protein [Listeria monocytogenes]EAC5934146.1 hypothetical protein [Listeria monocytogenes]EAC9089500.1 hypothetical protein [Listeria monocytogenes]EAD0743758.1 hypothetical protein [Listeria monocytogenes]EAD8106940.1 hypothetical protein [Listeria monocytogenes]